MWKWFGIYSLQAGTPGSMFSFSTVFFIKTFVSFLHIANQYQRAQDESPRDTWEVSGITSKFVQSSAFKWHVSVKLSRVSNRNKFNSLKSLFSHRKY